MVASAIYPHRFPTRIPSSYGPMDKASAYGAEDSGFESLCGQFLFALLASDTVKVRLPLAEWAPFL